MLKIVHSSNREHIVTGSLGMIPDGSVEAQLQKEKIFSLDSSVESADKLSSTFLFVFRFDSAIQ